MLKCTGTVIETIGNYIVVIFFLPNIIHSKLLRSNLYSESRLEFDIAKLHLEGVN